MEKYVTKYPHAESSTRGPLFPEGLGLKPVDREFSYGEFGVAGARLTYAVNFAIRSNSPFDADKAVKEATEMLGGVKFKRPELTETQFESDARLVERLQEAIRSGGMRGIGDSREVERLLEFVKRQGDDYVAPRIVWSFVGKKIPEGKIIDEDKIFDAVFHPEPSGYISVCITVQGYAEEENDRVVKTVWEVAEKLMRKYEDIPFKPLPHTDDKRD